MAPFSRVRFFNIQDEQHTAQQMYRRQKLVLLDFRVFPVSLRFVFLLFSVLLPHLL